MADLDLPADLHAIGTAQFDRLREQGLLFYYPGTCEVAVHNGFHFEFAISPSIARKPVLAANAPERKGKGGPFVDPDPLFVVARPGPDHVLELSMHAMLRPHYVLHTRLFAPQTDDLDRGDWAAGWAVMQRLAAAGAPPMMIYNCGYEGGASQGHKHTQIFVEPQPGFALFPEAACATAAAAGDVVANKAVPFQHYISRLDGPVTPDSLLETYQRLMVRVRSAHRERRARHPEEATPPGDGEPACSDTAYNMVLTPRWMCLTPRRRGGLHGTGAGSIGMMGLLWLKDERERAHWTELGMTDHLVWMGIPW